MGACLCLSQASAQRVAGVRLAAQALQLALQTLLGLPDVLQQLRSLGARLHRLGQRSEQKHISTSLRDDDCQQLSEV